MGAFVVGGRVGRCKNGGKITAVTIGFGVGLLVGE